MPIQQTIIIPRGGDGTQPSAVYVPDLGIVALLGAPLIPPQDSLRHQAASLTEARAAIAVFNKQPGLVLVATSATGSGDLLVGQFTELGIDINITAVSGTSPTLIFTFERKGADGVYYPVWTSASLNATGQTSASLGAGMSGTNGTALSFGAVGRLRWTITGTSPSYTLSISIIGK